MTSIFRLGFILISVLGISCYGFKGISISPEIQSFYVEDFTIGNTDAPADLTQVFAEALRKKIRQESRLVNNNSNPDITFEGSIEKYNTTGIAPEEGNTTSLNRLEISISISYLNELNPDENWKKKYSDFEDYDSTDDFQSIGDDLIEVIVEDIMERIFNDAFTNW